MSAVNRWEEELVLLQSIADKAGLDKALKWGIDVYMHEERNVFAFCGFKSHFALWFYNGVFLKDKYKVLVNAQDGKTKSLRQWRFTSKEEINEQRILEYVREAVAIERKGLKLAPEKTDEPPLPDILKAVFRKNKALKLAFDQLTPGRKKEYLLYIQEAKQEATRQKRIERIMPIILAGKGLNDRYK